MTNTTLRDRRRFAAVGVAAVLGVAVLAYLFSYEEPAPQIAHPSQVPQLANFPTQATVTAQAVAVPAPGPVSPALNAGTRSAQVAALLEKGTPAAAFEAYKLLAHCDTARTNERNARTPPDSFTLDLKQQVGEELANGSATERVSRYCGDLTVQQVGKRLAYLQTAAESGVPGAAVQLVMLPPDGMTQAEMLANWEAPEVLRWREKSLSLLKLAATKADLDALLLLKSMYHEGSPLILKPDLKLAFVYAVAYDAAYSHQNGRLPGTYHRNETNRLEAAIPLHEVQQLREQGLKLARG